MPAAVSNMTLDDVQQIVAANWGFRSFRPLQAEAIQAVLDRRDSLVVLPTGGGKSLCYQAPALVAAEQTTVVVSPLISLMKDQVDALRSNGIAAAQLNSSMSTEQQRACEQDLLGGRLRLLFVSPERLLTSSFIQLLRRLQIAAFAIDEAHCISQWGHDFRAEYRQMGRLKELFPDISVHAYTATATEPVRRDICDQLRLERPTVLVGSFDRPNLTYRVVPRGSTVVQVQEVVERHPDEAGIIYCISRRDVDELTAALNAQGRRALAYHAGLAPEARHAAQEAFTAEECNLVVATVAFGMGIDRSNVRFVLHTGMPKSLEHYQQETGRAGRDGLEAECVLLYARSDHAAWSRLMQKSAADADPRFTEIAQRHLDEMQGYCQPTGCRHRALVEYFGQQYPSEPCGACDVCLGGVDLHPESNTIAQKIISCVARVKERFGAGHIAAVLRGENSEAIRKNQHEELSTYGLLRDCRKSEVRDWIDQLVGLGALTRTGDEYPILMLNDASWEVLRGQRTVNLTRSPDVAPSGKGQTDAASWEGVDRGLFEQLRMRRKEWAAERSVPPYVIFSDATLRALARCRPASLERLRWTPGIGDAKLREFGELVLAVLDQHCREHDLTRDQFDAPQAVTATAATEKLSVPAERAAALFRKGADVDDVMQQMGRARSTVMGYLRDFVRIDRPSSVSPWVADDLYRQIVQTAERLRTRRLKPIFVELDGKASYDDIGIVMAHYSAQIGDQPAD